MMQKTYKSKRDTACGIDHRDMLLTVDEKSSAFDAFYIQNIKQTKRELSSIGSSNHHGVASNRVRKRKYVRRIIKEIEPTPRESMSTSVFLTPDKSIRVNKPLDPFDQLLNSSPVWPEAKQTETVDPFDQLLVEKETKTKPKAYTRKKTRAIKKFNRNPDTDKENSLTCGSAPQNTTDIKSHELYIAKESVPSPNIDDSIEKFINNLSLLKRKSSIPSVKNFHRDRLTYFYSPVRTSQMSPLSSTPMNNKKRSKSIYNLSPIPVSKLDDSPGNMINMTINEENEDQNKSVIYVPKNVTNPSKSFNKNQSPPTHNENKSETQKTSKPLFSSHEMESLHKEKVEYSNQIKEKNLHDSYEEILNKTHDTNSFQTSEIEPFVGFTNDTNNSLANSSIVLPLTIKKSLKSKSQRSTGVSAGDDDVQRKYLSKEQIKNEVDEANELNEKMNDSISPNAEMESDRDLNKTNGSCEQLVKESKLTEPTEPFLGVQASDNKSIDTVNSCSNSEPNSFDNNSMSSHGNTSTKSSLEHDENSTYNISEDKQSLNSQDTDKESLYDTCSSEHSSIADESNEIIKEPLVAVERLNDSVFENYYYNRKTNYNSESENMEKCNNSYDYDNEKSENDDDFDRSIEEFNDSQDESIEKSVEKSSNSFASFVNDVVWVNSDNGVDKLDGTDIDNCAQFDNDGLVGNYDTDPLQNETIVNEADATVDTVYEQRCFVTTRRRQDVVQSPLFMVLEDSNASLSSSNCDKTMLSNNCSHVFEMPVNDLAQDSSMTIVNSKETSIDNYNIKNTALRTEDLSHINKDLNDTHNLSDSDARISFITTRKCSKLPRISENPCKDHSDLETEMKPAIVLQPGKKWERSLSIYRRMTMANDNFDQSILEEEDMHMKGRKYRESVISMMEMQDCKGALQNDSIQSRRSTIICKPSRSTIRIVKDNSSRISLSSTSTDLEELRGFLEECDDTIIELSKLSIDENEVTVVEKFNEHNRVVATAREYVLRRCKQTEPLLFDECYPDTRLKNCRKIGEGVYGEVYLWRAPDGRARVMKVVPIAGSVRVNGECQKDYHEIISEIVIAMELSALRAPIAEIECHFDEGKDVDQLDLHAVENATDVFNEVLAVRCVFGNYPNRLLDLWDLYDECKGSENDNPAVLPPDQQYIVLELANAGEDLESFQFGTAEQAYALLLQVAFGLAVGEEAYQFEHRDLHWGNVLIAPTEQKYATFILRGRSYRVLRRGVAGTIIDYSLSRVSLPVGGAPCALYNDLGQDESLFGAVGDYQFEVYRLMRQKLGNEWKNFEPYTNVLWLHYLVDKMITSLRYKRPSTKVHKQYIAKLKTVKERILTYGSAVQFVLTDPEF